MEPQTFISSAAQQTHTTAASPPPRVQIGDQHKGRQAGGSFRSGEPPPPLSMADRQSSHATDDERVLWRREREEKEIERDWRERKRNGGADSGDEPPLAAEPRRRWRFVPTISRSRLGFGNAVQLGSCLVQVGFRLKSPGAHIWFGSSQ
ncbi:hypothetical protein HanPI659440_Chr16g0640021 [Helianthus annuus]|nr:hypothetical protein HanPI659440_Chr16g0640021 [Helianthus annuus]